VEFREVSLPGYERGSRGIEMSRGFRIDSCRIVARKERGDAKKTSCDSEIVIGPLSGHD
jgi:hypothetical protein